MLVAVQVKVHFVLVQQIRKDGQELGGVAVHTVASHGVVTHNNLPRGDGHLNREVQLASFRLYLLLLVKNAAAHGRPRLLVVLVHVWRSVHEEQLQQAIVREVDPLGHEIPPSATDPALVQDLHELRRLQAWAGTHVMLVASIAIIMISQNSIPRHLERGISVHRAEGPHHLRVILNFQARRIKVVTRGDDEVRLEDFSNECHLKGHVALVIFPLPAKIPNDHELGSVLRLRHRRSVKPAVRRRYPHRNVSDDGTKDEKHQGECHDTEDLFRAAPTAYFPRLGARLLPRSPDEQVVHILQRVQLEVRARAPVLYAERHRGTTIGIDDDLSASLC
mmetsp:Transcript_8427/g.24088  ORF Transcript_8427/g.24088 Transcript_8427/m.24088 type:complete len:334 (+) Transcript_8427:611-1612(+)